MKSNKQILAIVPARGGSKGLPLKNLRLVGGKPLVSLAGECLSQLNWIDRAIVSTDHPDIAKAAKSAGLDVPFYRPKNLSGDLVGDLDVLTHALSAIETLDKTQYDIILMIQPTSPLRKPEHITQTVDKLLTENLDSVWTVSAIESKVHPLKLLTFDNKQLKYWDPQGESIIARQQLSPAYFRNGAAYAFTRECLLHQKNILGKNASAVVIQDTLVDVDTLEDLTHADELLKNTQQLN